MQTAAFQMYIVVHCTVVVDKLEKETSVAASQSMYISTAAYKGISVQHSV